MSTIEDAPADWAESQPGYAHGFTEFAPGFPGRHYRLLSRGGSPLWARGRKRLEKIDIYFLDHLRAKYGSQPFKRGDLDAGRINLLLGQHIVFATEDQDPVSLKTLLRLQGPDASILGARAADRSERPYRYGTKPTWEIVLDAVRTFGRAVSRAEVADYLAGKIPDFARSNIDPDLSALSVNSWSRGNFSMNNTPRRTDSGNPYDQLIRTGRGRGVRSAPYDPKVHGVWELADVGDKVLRPRFVSTADSIELDSARDLAGESELFDPGEDARTRTLVAIVQREGQPAFRKSLLTAYGSACAVTGCSIEALLEAAHIVPYRGTHTNTAANGLLLRADLHKLFDLHLFSIDPETRTVRLSETLKNSDYAHFDNVKLREPLHATMLPSSEALRHHQERCGWLNVADDISG